jgi:hypothetical protein
VGGVYAALDTLARRYGVSSAVAASQAGAASDAGAAGAPAEPLVVLCEEVLKACCPLLQAKECSQALAQLQAAYAQRLAVERGAVDDA